MKRIFSILLAAVFSVFLFALMSLLIETEAKAFQSDKRVEIDFGQFNPEDLNPKPKEPKRPEPPELKKPPKAPEIATRPEKPVKSMPKPVTQAKPSMSDGDNGFNAIFSEGMGDSNQINGLMQRSPTIRINPRYPTKAQQKGIEGQVTVMFDINELGETVNIRVIASKPKGIFEAASRRAVAKWKFSQNGDEQSVAAVDQRVTLDFNLQE